MTPEQILKTFRPYVPLFALILILVLVFVICFWAFTDSSGVEEASAALAIADDFILRVAGIAILAIGIAGFVLGEVRFLIQGSNNDSEYEAQQKRSKQYMLSVKLGAAMALSGGAFFAGYALDDYDEDAEKLLSGQIPGLVSDSPAVLARWVQVTPISECRLKPGESVSEDCPPRFLIRAVVRSQSACPTVSLDFKRGRPNSTKLQLNARSLKRLEANEDFKKGFGAIRLCEREIEDAFSVNRVRFGDGRQVRFSGKWQKDKGPEKIAIFGDTGCRNNNKQVCDEESWPLNELAHSIRAEKPSLVIHVGDLMYVGDDSWGAWKDYFFDPARPLLEGAPWVVVRGNHERCGEHGQAPLGFYLFFAQDEGVDCLIDGDQDNPDNNELLPTYAVDLGNEHRLIVADSSIAYEPSRSPKCSTKDACEALEALKGAFATAGRLAKNKGTVWLATHVPPFALEWEDGKPVFPESSAMMLGLWREPSVKGVNVILSGDRHLFQVLKGKGDRPHQVTVGTGGVNLDPTPDGEGKEHISPPPEAHGWLEDDQNSPAKACSYQSFGYLIAKRGDSGYDMAFHPYGQKPGSSDRPCADYLP